MSPNIRKTFFELKICFPPTRSTCFSRSCYQSKQISRKKTLSHTHTPSHSQARQTKEKSITKPRLIEQKCNIFLMKKKTTKQNKILCKQTKKRVKISVGILTLHDIPVRVRLKESITTNKKVELNKTNDRTKQKK